MTQSSSNTRLYVIGPALILTNHNPAVYYARVSILVFWYKEEVLTGLEYTSFKKTQRPPANISRVQLLSTLMAFLRFLVCFFAFAVAVNECAHDLQKRSFVQLGCMGMFDRSKFARLDAICEECYELFREPDIHGYCRSNCFKNSYFSRCVDALLLTNQQEELDNSVRQLYGRRK